jgi:hypothetical protein
LHNSDTKYGNDDQTTLNRVVVPGLPSPTDSIGETSDYQRSTPSPKGEEGSKTGVSASGVESSVNTPPEHGVDIMKEDANDPGFGDEDDNDVTQRTEDGNYSLYIDSPYTFNKLNQVI